MIESVFPKYVMVQTSSLCNASCLFCPFPDTKDVLPQGVMSDDLFTKIIDECANYPHIERIMPYLMNEPLMDKKISERVTYIKGKNPNAWVHFLSNAALLNADIADKILKSSLDQICFSVYGINPGTYNKVMGLDFNKVVYNILEFKKKADALGKPKHYVMITFFKWEGLGEKEAASAIDFWQSQGVSDISVFDGPISRAGNAKHIKGPVKESVSGCNSIWTEDMFHILYNGDVVLCCMDWQREIVLGNVYKDSIYDIWHGEKYRKARRMVLGSEKSDANFICKRCESSLGSER